MYRNYSFKDVNEALPPLLRGLADADEVGSRAGRTREMTHVGITLTDPVKREILLPARKPNLAAQIAETMWVLGGRADIGWLEHYLPRVKDFSDDGETWRAGYGARLRHWQGLKENTKGQISSFHVDQIAWVFDHLKAQPASRRAVLSIWDPAIDTEDAKDIPCNDWLNFSSRLGYLDLHVAVRSNDVIWGWSGINQFEWSVLLEVMAGLLGLGVGSLHFSTTSFHIYDRHWAKADKIVEHACSQGYLKPSPAFDASALLSRDIDGFDAQVRAWFRLEESIRSGNMRESDVDAFREPMMRSWLRVLQWWWSGDQKYLAPLEGTRLERATVYSVQPPERETITMFGDDLIVGRIVVGSIEVDMSPFMSEVHDLHLSKDAAYGDSWMKRGEMFSVMPNIARKIDRLASTVDTEDETSADTAIDLFVYLAKYLTLLKKMTPVRASEANLIMLGVEQSSPWPLANVDPDYWEGTLTESFEHLLHLVSEGRSSDEKIETVEMMLPFAYRLARHLWETEQDEYRGADVD